MADGSSGSDPKKLSQADASVVCPTCKATIDVTVRYGTQGSGGSAENFKPLQGSAQDGQLKSPPDYPIKGVTVEIKGPTTQSKETDEHGKATFKDVPTGKYKVTATYNKKNSFADQAEGKLGDKNYAVDKDAGRFHLGSGTNKCNLFVYDMVGAGGSSVPTATHNQTLLGMNVGSYKTPPLAQAWGSSGSLGNWQPTTSPQPGDVVGQKIQYSNATGHSAVVGYPNPRSAKKDVDAQAGVVAVLLRLQWVTVGAGSHVVHETEFPFDKEHLGYSPPVFHHSGN